MINPQAVVSDKKALMQEVATLEQRKEKLEATLLQERQRASDGLVAFEALERRLSADQKSSHSFEQQRLEELQKIQDLSTSRVSELQHLKEQLVSAHEQTTLERRAREGKEAELQELLRERDPWLEG